ncbi:MAG TPA: tripartite tricarboxylate transporter substrate binding protein [Burkholderiales bacterium]|nr:tripartite tricarboxylate transporter substrate binding protein [Burkholderiales bacterium]
MRTRAIAAAAAMVFPLAAAVTDAAAQSRNAAGAAYPSRPIRMIDPFPPGGGTWVIGRVVEDKVAELLGQPIVHDSRGGAGGAIGTELAARAPADGYTLALATASTIAVNPLLSKVPFDPVKDFAPVAHIGSIPLLLVVHPSVPAKTVGDLIALAKARKGALNYASAGNGTLAHLAGELFKVSAGVSITHVPYKGGGPALNDVMGNQVQLFFSNVLSGLPFAKAGRLRALAVTGAKRTQAAPEIPTVAESGLPHFTVTNWYGVLAPARTSREIVIALNQTFNRAVEAPEVRDKLASLGAEAGGGAPEQFGAHVKAERAKWAKVIKQSDIRLE